MNWTIEKWWGATPSWVNDGTIPPFIAPMEKREESRSRVVDLFDGSEAVIIPPVKTRELPFDFSIFEADVTSALLSKLRGYQQNGIGIKITMGNGEKLEGYVMRVTWGYTASGSAWRKALTINFKPFDVDSSGNIND